MTVASPPAIPHQSYSQIFFRFLRFGCLAWGGPVAQIAMIKKELVEEEQWISFERFNRALAVYQVLPGPEAHELCVYFGMLARGRMGAVLAGLGFMLPGFALMFALSWVYVRFGIESPMIASAFVTVQAAVVALIVRAVHRIGKHALVNRWLWTVGALAGFGQFFGVHFGISLAFAGGAYALVSRRRHALAVTWTILAVGRSIAYLHFAGAQTPLTLTEYGARRTPGLLQLFLAGLSAGLLTFGGAYTAIPILQKDAVTTGAWMTNRQFLDGLGLSGILPAPMIIFATFVGYIGGGPLGAVLITLGVFLPAFSFTLIGHEFLERVIHKPGIHSLMEGVTAGVVGLIAATTIGLFRAGVTSVVTVAVFAGALFLVYAWKAKWAVAVVIVASGIAGLLLSFRPFA